MPNQEDIRTEPEMPAASNDQLLTRMAGQLSGLVATVNTIANSQSEFASKLVSLEANYDDLKGRVDQFSRRVRADEPSKHDLEAQAALASETAAREALAAKVDSLDKKQDTQLEIMNRVEGAVVTFWKSKPGVAIQWLAWGAFLGWLAKNNIHIPGINP